jgi:hypothetical protein
VGLYTSIAVDSNNHVHISYYDTTNHALKYATKDSEDWVISTIDSAGDVGKFSAIAVDSDNHVHISYYAVGYQVYAVGNLKYATNASGGWVTSTIDIPGGVGVGLYSSIGVGLYTSIAVDSNNIVHISYYDGTNHDLKYATTDPGHLFTFTIDDSGDVGQFSSIAVDSNNKVHISYHDMTSGELKYAETSTSCPPVLHTPVAASPANGVTGISTTPTLGWDGPRAAYSVQVCTDSACNNVVASATILTSNWWWTVSPELNNNTQYWWRIQAGNSCGNSSQWSGTRSFTTMTLPQSNAWTPKISAAPLSVNFGSVPVGGTSNARTVTIRNAGKEDLVINSITITGANQFEFIQNCSIVAAKSSCPIGVIFSPVAPFGRKNGIMSISFNDPKQTTIHVKLAGQAPPPKISVSPHSVNFGSATVGTTSATKPVTVRNTGVSDLTINEIIFTGTNAAEFAHTSDCTTVAKSGSCTVTIAFNPTSTDLKTATVSISSSDPKKSNVNVKLKGKGI